MSRGLILQAIAVVALGGVALVSRPGEVQAQWGCYMCEQVCPTQEQQNWNCNIYCGVPWSAGCQFDWWACVSHWPFKVTCY